MILSKFVKYIKQAWVNRPSTTTPLSAERMLHLEAGIKANNEAIEELAAAVLSNIVNDPNKIASMAVAYSLQQQITKLNSEFISYTDCNLENFNACYAKAGKIVVLFLRTPKIAMIKNEWFDCGLLPTEARPVTFMMDNAIQANSRNYYYRIKDGRLSLQPTDDLPADGLPSLLYPICYIGN